MIARLRRLRGEVLGLNRRNHAFLFAYNARDRWRVVDDKQATKRVLDAHGVATPMLHATCDVPWRTADLGERLAALPEFVLKPARGAGGAGIIVIAGRKGDRFVKASGAVLRRRDLEGHACDVIAGAYSPGGRDDVLLVEERLRPDPVLGAVAYRGVPDIRVLAFRGVPVLAMVRLPTRRSDGRANLHLGGLGVGVNLASGPTTYGVARRRAVGRHPDLGVALDGITVPAWDDVLVLAARAAEAVGLGFVGVDVVVDAERGPLVLELNARPGLTIQLANRRGLRPLLDAVAAVTPPPTPAERVALGREISSRARGGS